MKQAILSIEVFLDLPCMSCEGNALPLPIHSIFNLSPILESLGGCNYADGRHKPTLLSGEPGSQVGNLMFKEKYFSCNITSKHKHTTAQHLN